MTLGEKLKSLRLNHNKTQKEVASYLDITIASYSYYENNQRKPDYLALRKLVRYFNTSYEYLLDDGELIVSELRSIPSELKKYFELNPTVTIKVNGSYYHLDKVDYTEFEKNYPIDKIKGILSSVKYSNKDNTCLESSITVVFNS
jgi:transcriptional regulator with XRE-family HTH domain